MPLMIRNNKLLVVGGKLAVASACCCCPICSGNLPASLDVQMQGFLSHGTGEATGVCGTSHYDDQLANLNQSFTADYIGSHIANCCAYKFAFGEFGDCDNKGVFIFSLKNDDPDVCCESIRVGVCACHELYTYEASIIVCETQGGRVIVDAVLRNQHFDYDPCTGNTICIGGVNFDFGVRGEGDDFGGDQEFDSCEEFISNGANFELGSGGFFPLDGEDRRMIITVG